MLTQLARHFLLPLACDFNLFIIFLLKGLFVAFLPLNCNEAPRAVILCEREKNRDKKLSGEAV